MTYENRVKRYAAYIANGRVEDAKALSDKYPDVIVKEEKIEELETKSKGKK